MCKAKPTFVGHPVEGLATLPKNLPNNPFVTLYVTGLLTIKNNTATTNVQYNFSWLVLPPL